MFLLRLKDLAALLGFLLLLLWPLVTSCVTEKEAASVTREARRDTVKLVTVKADTLRLRDSVFLHEYLRGDTVFVYKEATRWRDRVATLTDTVYMTARDTLVKYEKVEEKARAPTKIISLAEFLCVLAAAAVIVSLLRYILNK